MPSRDLRLNSVVPFEMCGQQLVAFRGGSGAVHVLSAYCPHLGANLGVGGHVVTESESGDDCIQCPFHGWRFNGRDGQCKRIPNLNDSELKALKAVVKKWQTIEKNEMIYVWHHSEDLDPDHYPDDFIAKHNAKLVLQQSYPEIVLAPFQTIVENSSDVHHANYVHTELIPYVASLKYSFSSDYGHELAPVVQGTITLCVFKCTMATIPFILHVWSPVLATFAVGTEHSFGGIVVTAGICVPIRHDQTLLTTVLYTKRSILSSLFPLCFHYLVTNQISGDIIIWTNSQRPKRPVFTRNDEAIVRYR
ncbi:unnamed protein product, partial [Medioppia subpectinata]